VSETDCKIALSWLKKHWISIAVILFAVFMLVYGYGCEPKTKSLMHDGTLINRQELQLELDQLITMSQIRMADLDKQEELRAIILNNALILVQGQPWSPVGLLTGIAALYGCTQGGRNISQTVKNGIKKRKVNNGGS